MTLWGSPAAAFGRGVSSIAVQSDNKSLIGGVFDIPGPDINSFARLNTDGSFDDSFNPQSNSCVSCGGVYTAAIQPDGKIVVGGGFEGFDEQVRIRTARLNPDGSLDTTFVDPQVFDAWDYSSTVDSVAIQGDGKILIGGYFTDVGGQERDSVARLNANGSLDGAFENPAVLRGSFSYSPPGRVLSFVVLEDGKILIGGDFTDVGGEQRNSIARLNANGSLDATFTDPDVGEGSSPSEISSIAVQGDGKILIGGTFTQVHGQERDGLARLNPDGSLDTGFSPQINSSFINHVAQQPDGKILIGGDFNEVNGLSRWGVARLNADGSLDATFIDPGVKVGVSALELQNDGKVLIGGEFWEVGGQEVSYIARLNANGSLDTTFRASAPDPPAPDPPAPDPPAPDPPAPDPPAPDPPAPDNTIQPTPEPPVPSPTVNSPKATVTRSSVTVTSTVKVSGPGLIAQRATTGNGRKQQVWCRTSKKVFASGSYAVRCNLGKKGRNVLRRQTLKLKLLTTFTPTGGSALASNRTLTLKRKR